MKALLTHLMQDGKREKFLVEDFPEPAPPNARSFSAKTLFTGVTNGTEKNDLLGGNYAHSDDELPAPWGYQNVGEVTEIGSDVTDVSVGDIVFLSADHVERTTFDTDWKLYVKIPKSVDLKEASLFGMASVAMRTCRHADIRLGERVLVVGAGFIGQMAAQISKAMGGWVDLVDINQSRLDLAKKVGSVENTTNPSTGKWDELIEKHSYDVVIDVAGVPNMEDDLILSLTHRGRLMLIAGRHEVKYSFNEAQGRELHLYQNSHFDRSDLELLCKMVERQRVVISPFLQEVLSPQDAREFYLRLRDHSENLFGTVFDWTK